jgi:predicted enzyme related to lactoylglutathione lyase
MLRGFATVSYYADDMEAAKSWYADVLGIAPYFSVPGPDDSVAYYEFRVGDYEDELGLIDVRFAPPGSRSGPGGAIIFWHVDDLQASYERLLSLGATSYQPPIERGAGFVTAAVVDPFGNILGIMFNPHYLEMLASLGKPGTQPAADG